jgi:hypothetical protein
VHEIQLDGFRMAARIDNGRDVPRDLAEAGAGAEPQRHRRRLRRITAVERRREVMTRYADWLNDVRGKVLAFPTAKTV